jgi:hypothetical protein
VERCIAAAECVANSFSLREIRICCSWSSIDGAGEGCGVSDKEEDRS